MCFHRVYVPVLHCLVGCPILHEALDGLGQPFRVLKPFSGCEALHRGHVHPACVHFSARHFVCIWFFVFDLFRRTFGGGQEIRNRAGCGFVSSHFAPDLWPARCYKTVRFFHSCPSVGYRAPFFWFYSLVSTRQETIRLQCMRAVHCAQVLWGPPNQLAFSAFHPAAREYVQMFKNSRAINSA